MTQDTKFVLSILDEYYTFYSESQCGKCSLLIDGHCDMTCQKYPGGFSSDFWNNKKQCPNMVKKSDDI